MSIYIWLYVHEYSYVKDEYTYINDIWFLTLQRFLVKMDSQNLCENEYMKHTIYSKIPAISII